jgi:quercetin dioxygenase-like cupin family protein
MIGIASVLVALLFVLAGPALAQDATKADPDHYTVELENDEVRVLRITYGPGEKSSMHWHPDAVAVMLTDGNFVMHMPDGTTEDSAFPAGAVAWTPEVTHLPENAGDAEAVVILIEMKDDDDDDDDD